MGDEIALSRLTIKRKPGATDVVEEQPATAKPQKWRIRYVGGAETTLEATSVKVLFQGNVVMKKGPLFVRILGPAAYLEIMPVEEEVPARA